MGDSTHKARLAGRVRTQAEQGRHPCEGVGPTWDISLTGVRQESLHTEVAWGGDGTLMCAKTVTMAEENVHMGQGRRHGSEDGDWLHSGGLIK